MVLQMTRPTFRPDSAGAQFRKAVPKGIMDRLRGRPLAFQLPSPEGEEPLQLTITPGQVIKFSLRTSDAALAKRRISAANDQAEAIFSAYRNGPTPISQRQAVALSKTVHNLFVSRFQDNPGSPENWAAVKAFNRAISEGRIEKSPPLNPDDLTPNHAAYELFGSDLTAGVDALPEGAFSSDETLEGRFGWLTDYVLTIHAVVTDATSRMEVMKRVAQAAQDGLWQVKRMSEGDYSPDPKATRFPPLELANAAPHQFGETFATLFDRWQRSAMPSKNTLDRWKPIVCERFPAFLTRHKGTANPTAVTGTDITAYLDCLHVEGLKAKTIEDVHLAALKAIFERAKDDHIISTNPAAGRKSRRKRRGAAQEAEKGYSDTEAVTILQAVRALPATRHGPLIREAIRWCPWIAAYTGARIGEIAQLRKQDVRETEHGWTIEITPEAGTVKSGLARTVPMHSALIAEGLIEFIKGKADGPLFYSRGNGSPSNTSAKVGKYVKAIRGASSLQPSHAWRHRFVTLARNAGLQEYVIKRLVGHSSGDITDAYGGMSLKSFFDAIAQIPNITRE